MEIEFNNSEFKYIYTVIHSSKKWVEGGYTNWASLIGNYVRILKID